jgi:hypothetical protein
VVRFLIAADALNGLELPKLMDYTLAVSQLASGEPIASTEAFIKLVSKLSALEICLIFDADETEFDDAVAEALGAGQFLNRLLYHANQKVCSDSWWAPLDVQARNGITFASLSDESDSDKVEVAIVELSKMALRKLDTGLGLLDRQNKSIRNSDAFHHLILSSHIVQRRLRRLITHPQKHRDNPGGFGELMSTWRLAIKT